MLEVGRLSRNCYILREVEKFGGWTKEALTWARGEGVLYKGNKSVCRQGRNIVDLI